MAEDDILLTCGDRRPVKRAKTRASGWTKARRSKFLKVLAESCNVAMASRAAGAGNSAYELRRRDPAFAQLWSEALEIGYHRLETMLLQRALEGVNDIDVGALGDECDREAEATGHAVVARRTGAIARDGLARGDVQLALALLNRRREDGTRRSRGRTLLTTEEVDALLLKKLDNLARKRRPPA